MSDSSKAPRDWFRFFVMCCLLVLTGISLYNSMELRRLQRDLNRLQTPQRVPLADLRLR